MQVFQYTEQLEILPVYGQYNKLRNNTLLPAISEHKCKLIMQNQKVNFWNIQYHYFK